MANYYEPAYDLGISMLFRLHQHKDIVRQYLKDDQYLKAINHAMKHRVTRITNYNDLVKSIIEAYSAPRDG